MSLRFLAPNRSSQRAQAQPALADGCLVSTRADVLHDVGVVFTAGVQAAVVGFAHGQEVGRGGAGHQLEDVGDEGRCTQTKGVNSCGWKVPTLALLSEKLLTPSCVRTLASVCVPMKRTALRMKELKLHPAALMLDSAAAPRLLRD